jgi:Bacterial aa3 type cytochrome c oxidase subunit IV
MACAPVSPKVQPIRLRRFASLRSPALCGKCVASGSQGYWGYGMADDHTLAAVDGGMDMPAHEATYAGFVGLTETSVVALICIVLELVLWGLKGQGAIALIGFILTIAAAAFGGMSGLTWRAVLPVFVLLGLACIVL